MCEEMESLVNFELGLYLLTGKFFDENKKN